MDELMLTECREELEGQKETLKIRIAALQRDKLRERGAISPTLSDQAQEVENDEVVDSLLLLERQKLSEVTLALSKIASGNYGVCISCGEGSAENRLKAAPQASVCIKCS